MAMLNNQKVLLAMESKWFGGRIDVPPSFEIHPMHPRGLAAPPLSEKQAAVQDTAGLTKRPAARQLSSELERMSGASHVCFFMFGPRCLRLFSGCVISIMIRNTLTVWHVDVEEAGTAISLSRMILSWSILRVSRCERDVYFSEPWMSVFFFKDLNSLTSRHCICRQQGI